MAVEFAVAIPQIARDGAFDVAACRAHLRRVEELGLGGAWVAEQVLGTLPLLAPLEVLAYAAAVTERVRLGCAALISPHQSPLHLAKAIASLDHLSGGRIEVALATGGPARDLGAFGITADGLVTRFTEGFELMRAAWTQERFDVAGRFFEVTGGALEPKPLQRPHPPVWFGGGHPHALRRAVRLADGFFGAGSSTTAQFTEAVRTVRAELAATGRDPATFRIAKRVYLYVDDDPERARAAVRDGLAAIYGFFGLPDLTPVGVWGPPADVARGLREVVGAGAQLVLLHPMADDGEQLERLAGEVLPLV
jgi:alkanesulfonate monooxygenase SsuD/methylene tetrahydromethanopterin reductase-like flavin-dependent oxidoreductase (luciferase family)